MEGVFGKSIGGSKIGWGRGPSLYEKQFNQEHRDLANIQRVLMRVNILLPAGGENEIMMVRSRRIGNKPYKAGNSSRVVHQQFCNLRKSCSKIRIVIGLKIHSTLFIRIMSTLNYVTFESNRRVIFTKLNGEW